VALAAAARAAADWGAELTGSTLRLPVLAGLRHGLLEGELAAEPVPGGSRLILRVARSEYRLRAGAVSLLVLGGLGGSVLVLWPFYPRLLRLAPLGVVLALAAWFVVLSRLRVSGPEEFLETVAAVAGGAGSTEDAGNAGDTGGNPGEGPPGL
jgi:hypothetical protein